MLGEEAFLQEIDRFIADQLGLSGGAEVLRAERAKHRILMKNSVTERNGIVKTFLREYLVEKFRKYIEGCRY